MNENDMMQGDEISLRDLVDTLAGGWKIWVATSVVGVAVGFGAWSMQGYKAELVANTRLGALDMITWNGFAASLPALAEQRLEAASGSAEQTRVLRAMAQPTWWKANVTPGYLLTKGDVKDLASVSKEILDAGATSIQRLTIRAGGADPASVRRDAQFIEGFIRDGALYLALKAIISRYELEVATQPLDLRQKMTANERELYFLNQRAEGLEALRKQFPERSEAMVAQVMDPKDSGAKYLPLSTQMVALKTDINAIKESLARNKLRLDELAVYRKFVDGASPLLAKTENGFKLAEALVANEKALRKALDPAGAAGQLAIDTIARDLENAVVKVGGMFESEPLVLTTRPKLSLPLVLGLLGGLLVGGLLVFVADGWRRAKMVGKIGA